ncbi:MAG: MFS transporter [Anaerolineae bacterium]|nr:MFS transporter [Anaerolineae bacterium]
MARHPGRRRPAPGPPLGGGRVTHRLLARHQLRLLLPLGTAVSLSLAGDSTLYAVLGSQADALGITLGAVGLLLGVNRLIRIPANPVAGALNDRYRRRPLFLLGMALGTLSTVAYGLVRGLWPLLAARVLWGTAWALINVGGYAMVLDSANPADRGRMTGFYQLSYMLGLTVSPIAGGTLTDLLGFRPAVFTCAALTAVGWAIAWLFLPETRRAPGAPPAARRPAPAPARARRRLPSPTALLQAARRLDPQAAVAALIYLAIFFVSNGVLMSTLSLHLARRWGPAVAIAGLTVGVSSLAGVMLASRAALGILAGPAAGIASDRLGSRWPVALAALALAAAGFVILALPGSVWLALAGVALVASGAGALITAVAALAGDLAAGRRTGAAMGALATAGDVGSAGGPLVAYALATRLDLPWIYFGCALLLGCVWAAAFLGRRRRRRPSALDQRGHDRPDLPIERLRARPGSLDIEPQAGQVAAGESHDHHDHHRVEKEDQRRGKQDPHARDVRLHHQQRRQHTGIVKAEREPDQEFDHVVPRRRDDQRQRQQRQRKEREKVGGQHHPETAARLGDVGGPSLPRVHL